MRLTSDHLVLKADKITRKGIKTGWIKAGNLRIGDKILINNHRNLKSWEGPYGENEGYLLGLLIGDGTLKEDKAVLSVWAPRAVVNGEYWAGHGPQAVMERVLEHALKLPHRSNLFTLLKEENHAHSILATDYPRCCPGHHFQVSCHC